MRVSLPSEVGVIAVGCMPVKTLPSARRTR